MSRDQRLQDNWALAYAQDLALAWKQPLVIVFQLVPDFLRAQDRAFRFLLEGLQQLERSAHAMHIGFVLLIGEPRATIPAFCDEHGVSVVVTDESPLTVACQWKKAVGDQIKIPFVAVDAHNIVPVWVASNKQEYAARTFRPKMERQLEEWLQEPPLIERHQYAWKHRQAPIDWKRLLSAYANIEYPITWCVPGEEAAQASLRAFLRERLSGYAQARNNPVQHGQSNLSPYLHFGHLSAQRVAWEVQQTDAPHEDKRAFLEELIVRRELAENFCWYNPQYDSLQGAAAWAQQTLQEHARDPRAYLYTYEQLCAAKTHDDAWNAAQIQMVQTGKMHGYMRMYWAKKILEWTESPEQALQWAIRLNDTYSLDGRDPNGYVGIAWSIAGVHDRAWTEREIFGKIRYMNFNGLKRKFPVQAYIDQWVPPTQPSLL